VLYLSSLLGRLSAAARFVFDLLALEWVQAAQPDPMLLERARAHLAVAELERCLRLRRNGGDCRRFAHVSS
jgi:hypothetical protein